MIIVEDISGCICHVVCFELFGSLSAWACYPPLSVYYEPLPVNYRFFYN